MWKFHFFHIENCKTEIAHVKFGFRHLINIFTHIHTDIIDLKPISSLFMKLLMRKVIRKTFYTAITALTAVRVFTLHMFFFANEHQWTSMLWIFYGIAFMSILLLFFLCSLHYRFVFYDSRCILRTECFSLYILKAICNILFYFFPSAY